jgi:hypothetical protein
VVVVRGRRLLGRREVVPKAHSWCGGVGVDPGVGFRRVAGWGSELEAKLGFGSICDIILGGKGLDM